MAEAKRRCSQREFRQWQAMYRIEPFGDDWLQAASIVAKIHNVNCKERIKPSDVIPQFVSNQPAASLEQSQAFFKTFGSAVKATKKKKPKP